MERRRGASSLIVKLSFCIAVLALDEWKANPKALELPLLVYNYFEHVDDFICFSFACQSRNNFTQLSSVLRSQAALAPLLMFMPRKPPIEEKRLYTVSRKSILKIIQEKKWQKLLDPRDCECWIHLPKKSSKLNRNFSFELNEEKIQEDGLAKLLIKRKEKKNFSFKSISSEAKFSLFKKNYDQPEKVCDNSISENLNSPLSVKNISQITMQSQFDPRDDNQTIQNFSRFLACSSPNTGLSQTNAKFSSFKNKNPAFDRRHLESQGQVSMRIPEPDTLDFDFDIDEGALPKPPIDRFSFNLRKRNLFMK